MRLLAIAGLLSVAATAAPAAAQSTMTCTYNAQGGELVLTGADSGNRFQVPGVGQRLEYNPGRWAYLMDYDPKTQDGNICPQRMSFNTQSYGSTMGGQPQLDYSRFATYGTYNLNSGFTPDPHQINLTAGGPVNMSTATQGQCSGFASAAPDVRLHFQGGNYNEINFSAFSEGDTTLIINDPNGNWYCDDDSGGNLNPLLSFTPMSGQYDIWVGTYDRSLAAATLAISELPYNPNGNVSETSLGGGPDYSLPPTYGHYSLYSGFTPDPYEIPVVAGGEIDIAAYTNNQCVGYVAEAPDVRLDFTEGSYAELIFSVDAYDDTTLIINDPNGNWFCDDDSGVNGMNPALSLTPMSGQYDIWIGTYDNATARARLAISEL